MENSLFLKWKGRLIGELLTISFQSTFQAAIDDKEQTHKPCPLPNDHASFAATPPNDRALGTNLKQSADYEPLSEAANEKVKFLVGQ